MYNVISISGDIGVV